MFTLLVNCSTDHAICMHMALERLPLPRTQPDCRQFPLSYPHFLSLICSYLSMRPLTTSQFIAFLITQFPLLQYRFPFPSSQQKNTYYTIWKTSFYYVFLFCVFIITFHLQTHAFVDVRSQLHAPPFLPPSCLPRLPPSRVL